MSNLPDILVTPVRPEDTWSCELCENAPVIAYVTNVDDPDVTHGYCAGCIGGVIDSTVTSVLDLLAEPECSCSSGILGFPIHREGCPKAVDGPPSNAPWQSGDDTPFGRGGDHCPWCGYDWKAAHAANCARPEGE